MRPDKTSHALLLPTLLSLFVAAAPIHLLPVTNRPLPISKSCVSP